MKQSNESPHRHHLSSNSIKKPDGHDVISTYEDSNVIANRVTCNDSGVVIAKTMPQPSSSLIHSLLDEVVRKLRAIPRLVLDLRGTVCPNHETCKTLHSRLNALANNGLHIGFCIDDDTQIKTMLQFAMQGIGFESMVINTSFDECVVAMEELA